MKAENILHADLLDIIFQNRNKEYGAYTIRKYYDARLIRSFGITLFVVLSFILFHYINAAYFKKKTSEVAGLPVHQLVYIKPVQAEKPKEVIKEIKRSPNQHAQKSYTEPLIVKDDVAHKNLPEVKELDNKMISNIDKEGSDVGDEVLIPAEKGDEQSGEKMAEQQAEPVQPPVPLHHAEVMPEFPGGMEAFKKFMLRHLRQPDLNEGDKVVVKVHFVVDADGSIKGMNVIQSGGHLDAEVLRVVGKMPKWKPGIQNGRNVPVYFTLPVTFLGPEM